jgi:predicted acetyltransferase
MSEQITHPKPKEITQLTHFMEDAFGHYRGFFRESYPHLYQNNKECASYAHILKKNNKTVSHVGIYPMQVKCSGIKYSLAGIGGVATSPQERGKGYMSKMMRHAVKIMREQKFSISALNGDRKRYNEFGWELAGAHYNLDFTKRSLQRGQVKGIPAKKVTADEALPVIKKMHTKRFSSIGQEEYLQKVYKPGLYFWINDNGYAIGKHTTTQQLDIYELVSLSEKELETICAIQKDSFNKNVNINISWWENNKLQRLLPGLNNYTLSCGSWMYRIIDIYRLLCETRKYLENKLQNYSDFNLSLGIADYDQTDQATLIFKNRKLEVLRGKKTNNYMELSPPAAASIIFRGLPYSIPEKYESVLNALFPVPIYIDRLDYV